MRPHLEPPHTLENINSWIHCIHIDDYPALSADDVSSDPGEYHYHDYVELLYSIKTDGYVWINGIPHSFLDGDLIVVEKSCTAEDGDIIVALVEDEATVKTFYRDGNRFRLQPENSSMEPIYVDELLVLGKVVACMRFYK